MDAYFDQEHPGVTAASGGDGLTPGGVEIYLPEAVEGVLGGEGCLVLDAVEQVVAVPRAGNSDIWCLLLVLPEQDVALDCCRVFAIGDHQVDGFEVVELLPPVVTGVSAENEFSIHVDADSLQTDHRGQLRERLTVSVPRENGCVLTRCADAVAVHVDLVRVGELGAVVDWVPLVVGLSHAVAIGVRDAVTVDFYFLHGAGVLLRGRFGRRGWVVGFFVLLRRDANLPVLFTQIAGGEDDGEEEGQGAGEHHRRAPWYRH